MTWKLDTWERNNNQTIKIRLETKQYLDIINAGERNFVPDISIITSNMLAYQKEVKPTTEPKEGNNSTTLFVDARNQSNSH
jgi:hypothetical protein